MLVLCSRVSCVALFIYSSALFVEETVTVTVEEVSNLSIAYACISDFCSKILYHLPCRWNLTLSKLFYIPTKVLLLLWVKLLLI